MVNILFSKYSNERNEEFQVVTTIEETQGTRYVKKRALNQKARKHIDSIYDNYKFLKNDFYLTDNVKINTCKLGSNNDIQFEFIDGIRLDERISKCIKQKNYKQLFEEIDLLVQIIKNVKDITTFRKTKEFIDVFGDITVSGDYLAAPASNIDLLTSNIIINDYINIVDYEWVFYFPIPLNYIIFRLLLLNEQISSLSDDIKWEIYNRFGINKDDYNIFLQMEINFQNYVSGGNKLLSHLYEKMPIKNYTLDKLNLKDVFFDSKVSIVQDNNIICILNKVLHLYDVELNVDLTSYNGVNEVILEPVDVNCIVKIISITGVNQGNNEEVEIIDNNADLVIFDDYYYGNVVPKIKCKNNQYQSIEIKYKVYKKNDTQIIQLIDFIKENYELKMAYEQLPKNYDDYLVELKNRHSVLQDDYRSNVEKLTALQNEHQNIVKLFNDMQIINHNLQEENSINTTKLNKMEQDNQNMLQQCNLLKNELDIIHNSFSWRFINRLKRIIHK